MIWIDGDTDREIAADHPLGGFVKFVEGNDGSGISEWVEKITCTMDTGREVVFRVYVPTERV